MLKKITKYNSFYLILIFLSVFWQSRFLFLPGLFTFSDESHLANLHQMIAALQSGQIPPRWAPNFSYNFGHPFFNFYYLLPYLVGSFFYLVFNFSLILSLKSIFFLSLLTSGIAMYYLGQKFFNKSTSFAISIIYLFTPYRAVDLYVRGSIGELFGFVFMPLVLLTFINLLKSKHFSSLFWAVISLSGLIISHNLTILIFFPILLLLLTIYLFQNIPPAERIKSSIRTIIAFFLSFLLSSFYLLPALLEKKYMQTGTPFNPIDHFPFIKQLIIPYWGYGASVWGPTDQLSFQIGVINLLIVLFVCLMIIFSKFKYKSLAFGLLIVFFSSVVMMNIRSLPIWQLIPIASYVQFPWRFLIITTFTTSLLSGFISLHPKNNLKNVPLFLAALSILFTYSYFAPHKVQKVDDNYYLNRFFINQNSQNNPNLLSAVYQYNSEDYLPLTIWTSVRPNSLLAKVETSPDTIISEYKEISAINYQFNLDSVKVSTVFINNYYFPGWQAYIDSKPVKTSPSGPLGRIGFQVPNGQHQIFLKFENTPIRQYSNLISLLTFIILFIFFLKTNFLNYYRTKFQSKNIHKSKINSSNSKNIPR